MAEHLWELANDVNDARELLERALNRCAHHLTDQHSGEPLPWIEMGETSHRISNAFEILRTALEPIKAAIEEEAAYNDEMADRADGASY